MKINSFYSALTNCFFVAILLINITAQAQEISSERKIFIQDSLAFELSKIYGFDQGIRDRSLAVAFSKHSQEIDTLNFNKMVDFVIKHGYPTAALVGERNLKQEAVDAAFVAVLLHNPHRLVNEKYYYDLFFEEVKKGRITADFFTTVLDKYYWINSKNKTTRRVFYGSAFGSPCIQTKKETNKARIEIGLKPLLDSEFVDCAGEELILPKIRT